ncbi:MAG TPA: DnaJ C-terminal domain-containing protein [bacterium]|jgi:curved DNA-binding protein
MDFKDYYKILSVARNADQKTITAAFRKLARQYHPDVNKDKSAEDRFKEVNEAYQVLGKPDARAKYDQMFDAYQHGGANWQEMFGQGGAYQQAPGGWTVSYGSAEDLEDLLGGAGGFSDFFRQFFGGATSRGRAAQTGRARVGTMPPDAPEAHATLEITLEDAYLGAQKSLQVQVNGASQHIEVTIPKGIHTGQTIRLPAAVDGADLFLTIKVQPHPRFEPRGDDVLTEVPIPLTDAVLGATIEVPTLGGRAEMTVPPETQNGQLFRLRGQGMPRRTGGAGDQLVRIKVMVPRKLTPRERELFEELRRLRQKP